MADALFIGVKLSKILGGVGYLFYTLHWVYTVHLNYWEGACSGCSLLRGPPAQSLRLGFRPINHGRRFVRFCTCPVRLRGGQAEKMKLM